MRSRPWVHVSLAALLLVISSCGAPPPPPQDDEPGFVLLVPNAADGSVSVVRSSDLLEGGTAVGSWVVDAAGAVTVTGLSLGPDGRVYVSDGEAGAIYVVDPGDVTNTGVVTPSFAITSPDLVAPTQGSFDGQGRFWVPDGQANAVVRFDGLADLAPAEDVVELEANLVLDLGRSFNVYGVFIDGNDNLWTFDSDTDSVLRFDASVIGDLTDGKTVDPGLELAYAVDGRSPSGQSVSTVTSLWVTDGGSLFVGNAFDQVSRFDDVTSLTGEQEIQADAYLSVGAPDGAGPGPFASMVAFDDDGLLWIGFANGELVQVADAASYDGSQVVRDDAVVTLRWAEEGGPGTYLYGGNPIFVPVTREQR